MITKINGAISADISTKKEPAGHKPIETLLKHQLKDKPVSDDWKLLARLQPMLQQIDDIDQSKVSEIRQSLSDGSFSLDMDTIAEAMLSQHGKSNDK